MARLNPVAPAELDGDARALADEMAAAMQADEPGVRVQRDDGALTGPFPAMLRFPAFGRAAWEYTRLFMGPRVLPDAVRQVAILVVASRTDARYELSAHELVARTSGLTSAQVAILAAGERPDDLDEPQSIAHAAARALVDGRQLPDSTYRAAVDAFTERGAAELIFLVGSYVLLGVILNGYDVPVPDSDQT